MPPTQPLTDWPRLLGRIQTADKLAPLGGRRADHAASLPTRLVSRVRSATGLVFTARQKRFNLETTAALADLVATVQHLQGELAVAHARIDGLLADLEPPHFRPGTMDEGIWGSVVRHNEYRLPDTFGPKDVILDVGGHIGSFAFSCLRRGAGAVTSFEPDANNHAMASLNVARFNGRGTVVRGAVWRSDVPAGTLTLVPSTDPTNTGGGGVVADSGTTVPSVPFDDVLSDALSRAGASRVRLLKLDCEGSEYPILLTSQKLHLIDAMCGEYHESGHPAPVHARVNGETQYDRHTLKRCLESNGFTVELCPSGPDSPVGLFFAKRK